jgi:hypothetical protein
VTGAPPHAAATDGWRVRSEHATVALAVAVVVGLAAGVLFGLLGRGEVPVQAVTVQQAANGAEVVPASAVVVEPGVGQPIVFVVVNHHALRQPVSVAASAAGTPSRTVTSGLSPDAVVVVSPPDTLHDGSPVRITPAGGGR